jgi:hypothetical protein
MSRTVNGSMAQAGKVVNKVLASDKAPACKLERRSKNVMELPAE